MRRFPAIPSTWGDDHDRSGALLQTYFRSRTHGGGRRCRGAPDPDCVPPGRTTRGAAELVVDIANRPFCLCGSTMVPLLVHKTYPAPPTPSSSNLQTNQYPLFPRSRLRISNCPRLQDKYTSR